MKTIWSIPVLFVAGGVGAEEVLVRFTDVTAEAGLVYSHGSGANMNPVTPDDFFDSQYKLMAGGVAVGDYDRDGWVDLYVVRGAAGTNLLFRNLGNGQFEEQGQSAGVDFQGYGNGPVFADYDGDGWLDLFVGGVAGTAPILARNTGDGKFEVVENNAGIKIDRNTFSSTFADIDQDGDLDLFTGHWQLQVSQPALQHLWRNDGNNHFTDISMDAGLGSLISRRAASQLKADIFTFSGLFSDINLDGWPDLLVAGDFSSSRVYVNLQDNTFDDRSDISVLTDENAMGVATADYDNDGDLDWFVTSIFHGDEAPYNPTRYRFGFTGNRLYSNLGNGEFEDVTERAGVREGRWGWAACFADFNNDGFLDLFHVNGMGDPKSDWWQEEMRWFLQDSSKLFISNRDGTFTERGVELGIADTGQGRGVSCLDYDRDGDIDIFVANNGQPPKLYRNDLIGKGVDGQNYIGVILKGSFANTEAIGAIIYLKNGDHVQMREIQAGTNFLSQNPAEAHFGLGEEEIIQELCVKWPGQAERITRLQSIKANQLLAISYPAADQAESVNEAACDNR